MKMKKRILATALSICMVISMMPVTTFAAEHVHDASCGYQEASACNHQHDADCGGEQVENTCTHTCTDGGECGYSAGSACTYSAEPAQDSGDTAATYSVSVTPAVTGQGATTSYGHVEGNNGSYAKDATVTLTAEPAGGKCFLRWNVTEGGVSAPGDGVRTFTFTMPAQDVKITAQFGDHTAAYLDLGNGNHKQHCMHCGKVYIESEAHKLGEYEPEGERGHYANCIICNRYQTDLEPHDYTDSSDATCDTCSYTRTVTPGHTHSYITNYDGTNHWEQCSCGDRKNSAAHSYTINYSNNRHWEECSCGQTKNSADHSYTNDSDATCDTCGYERTITPSTTYTVTFYPNGGSGSMKRQTFEAGVEQALTYNAFTRTGSGYIFTGWNTQADGSGTSYSQGQRITLTSDLTLYAQWKELTITASPASLTGNGEIEFTTSFDVGGITCSESKYERYIEGSGKNWTFQMKNNVTTDLTFTITYGGKTASCTVSFVQDPDALILTPSRTSLTGNGTITLTGNKDITGITCSNQSYETDISGSGQNWQFVMDRNVDVNLRFEATTATGETALCWITFNQYNPPSSYDDGDDDYTPAPSISTETGLNADGETVTTAWPTTSVRNGTATTTITTTDGNRIINELIRNDSDQLRIAPRTGGNANNVNVTIPASVMEQLGSRTDADLVIATSVAEVTLSADDIEKHIGSLMAEAQRTENSLGAKVTIGGETVVDAGVTLPGGLKVTDGMQLVVGTIDGEGSAARFQEAIETLGLVVEKKESQRESGYLGSYTAPGENPIVGLISGKTYDASVVSALDVSLNGWDEALYDALIGRPQAITAAKEEEVERLKADMDAKRAALDQLDANDPKHMEVWAAWYEAETAYKESLAELAEHTGLQGAAVTQSFQVPTAYVNNPNVKFVAVHDTNTNPYAEANISDIQLGNIRIAGDGKIGTAIHSTYSFSPFIVYAFVEQPEQEAKVR